MQSLPVKQLSPSAQSFGQEPPQSTPVSSPFLLVSVQLTATGVQPVSPVPV
jgi:hypothetical protein